MSGIAKVLTIFMICFNPISIRGKFDHAVSFFL